MANFIVMPSPALRRRRGCRGHWKRKKRRSSPLTTISWGYVCCDFKSLKKTLIFYMTNWYLIEWQSDNIFWYFTSYMIHRKLKMIYDYCMGYTSDSNPSNIRLRRTTRDSWRVSTERPMIESLNCTVNWRYLGMYYLGCFSGVSVRFLPVTII